MLAASAFLTLGLAFHSTFGPRPLSSAETSDRLRGALVQPIFMMQAVQDLLRSDLAFPLQSVPVHLDSERGLSRAFSGIPGPKLDCGHPLL
jgi:hypothetical protein